MLYIILKGGKHQGKKIKQVRGWGRLREGMTLKQILEIKKGSEPWI